MKKNIFLAWLFILALLINITPFPASSQEVPEEEECEPKALKIVIRDGYGDFVPDIRFDVYRQTEDVDGLPKPALEFKKASGIISSALGYDAVEFRDDDWQEYALKVYDRSINNGDYWFYDQLYLDCGDALEETFTVSSLDVSLWNTDDEPLKNYTFKIYTQRYDIEGGPIHEKDDLVGTFNTSEEGGVVVYLPGGADTMDGEGADYHVLEFNGPDGGVFTVYDNEIISGQVTDLRYTLSDIRMIFRDEEGVYFPANTKIEFFEQKNDNQDQSALGEKVKDLYTNDSGEVIFTYPAGTYAARVMNADSEYEYFWDLEITEEGREEYTLQTGSSWSVESGECDAVSNMNLVIRDLNGQYLSGLNYALYEQALDADEMPIAKAEVLSGVVDEDGRAIEQFNPDPRETYALQIWDLNKEQGDFWFFNEFKVQCGEDVALNKSIPALSIILRNGDGSLAKNRNLALYTQKHDVDGAPIKEKQDLVSSRLSTTEEGGLTVYLAPDHPYISEKKGLYVMEAKGEFGQTYQEFDIEINPGQSQSIEYVFSDIIFTIKEANGLPKENYRFAAYTQNSGLKGGLELGGRIASLNTDASASARLEYPAGLVALQMEDDTGQAYVIWNNQIKDKTRTYQDVVLNSTRVTARSSDGLPFSNRTRLNIYSMKKVNEGEFTADRRIETVTLDGNGQALLSLAPNPYLFTVSVERVEYGQVFYAELGKSQEVDLSTAAANSIIDGQVFAVKVPAGAGSPGSGYLADKLKGYILLQVEQNGEAWYVHPEEGRRYYMKDGETAYEMMRRFGLGITTANLNKIPVGINERFEEFDYDGDYVFDKMEEALGTDMYDHDSDDDGYDDGTEVENGFNPLGAGRMELDQALADNLRGRIVLQVESRGEAWYIDPQDGRRYYMKDGDSAYEIMRFLSLGITDANLETIISSEL